MNLHSTVTLAGIDFLWIDVIGLGFFFACWFGYTRYADGQYGKRLNLIRIMDDMRARWMSRVLQRENRISDATLLGNIMRTISFFASTTILILLGIFTILGAAGDKPQAVVSALPFTFGNTPIMWEIKLSLLMLIFIYAFFKLTWSLRQYNYACIIVGAAPPATESNMEKHAEFATRAGKLVSNAGRHFNMGLRAYYFGMAAVSWFINGIVFIAVTTLVIYVVHRREFRSHTVNNLIAIDDL